jgi:hypothetical protein
MQLPKRANGFAKNSKSICQIQQIDLLNSAHVLTDINTDINTASSSAAKPDALRKGDGEEAEGFYKNDSEDECNGLKTELLKLDGTLILSVEFYPQAVMFMRDNGLDNRYLSWIYEYCVKQKPRTLRGYFYRSFFKSELLGLFRFLQNQEERKAERKTLKKICPVCGAEYESECGVCGFSGSGNDSEIARQKKIYAMPEEKRHEYKTARDKIMKEHFEKKTSLAEFFGLNKQLNREYGLEE